jgi:tripartite-type tricarboxylate transporter receptor subunit TctC
MRQSRKVLGAARRTIAASLCAAAAISIAGVALAQSPYPTRPIKLIAPFPPGGSSDILCRLLAQKLTEGFGQTVVVENRPGASGAIGFEAAAKAPSDGYTIIIGSSSTLATNPHLFKKLPYDPINDFAPVSLVATSPQVLVVHPSVKANTVAELIALAKAAPGTLNFGSGGKGIQSHISGEMFKTAANIDIVHVPYKGGGQAVADLVTGQIQMVFADMVPAIPHIRSGRLRALAVTGETRSQAVPDIPTMIEAGVKDYRAELWWAILAPRGTSADIVRRLNGELGRIMRNPDVQAKYTELGVATVHGTPAQVSEFIKARSVEVGRILKAVGIEPE